MRARSGLPGLLDASTTASSTVVTESDDDDGAANVASIGSAADAIAPPSVMDIGTVRASAGSPVRVSVNDAVVP